MLITIRNLLELHDFNWEEGVIVVPAGSKSQNVLVPTTSKVLDKPFTLEYDDEGSRCPIFTAEDLGAMYVLCTVPEVRMSIFQRIDVNDLEGMQLLGINGYLYGPKNSGLSLEFKNPLEVFVTKLEREPAVVGCPQIHHYCIGEDRKAAMDLFTTRILTGYMNTKNPDSVKEGYAKVLKRFFRKLDVKERTLPPIEEGE